jgi:Mrp family chromosome partitioning ATPase
VKHTVLVLSGKGGVGKSTFSAQLAFTLAASGRSVGLLDIDICGPSIPRMLGLTAQRVHQSATGWSPVWVDDNLGVMSIGFMLPEQDDAIIWRGPRKNGLIKQFLTDVEWGALDYLIIDTPPGTSDEHISIAQLLKDTPGVDGAVVITTPQEVAMADVRKELNFCKKTGLPVLGVVENMSGFLCPCCGHTADIFPAAGAGPRGMADKFGVAYLGALPVDPLLLAACEAGEAYVVSHPHARGVAAFKEVTQQIVRAVEGATAVLGPIAGVDDDEDGDEAAAVGAGVADKAAAAAVATGTPAAAAGTAAEEPS